MTLYSIYFKASYEYVFFCVFFFDSVFYQSKYFLEKNDLLTLVIFLAVHTLGKTSIVRLLKNELFDVYLWSSH